MSDKENEDMLNQIKNAVDSLHSEVSAQIKLPKATLLLTIDDVCPHIPLKTLRQITSNDATLAKMLQLEMGGLIFDENLSKQFFSSTGWRTASAFGSTISITDLNTLMPPGVVSGRAHSAAVWYPILSAFDRGIGRTTMIQDKLVTIIQGGKKEYLTCFNLKNKQFACTCDAFNTTAEKERIRHLICKHLFRTIYHHYEAFTPLKINNPWNESLKEIEKTVDQKDKTVLLTNWLYYFTRHVFAKLEFKATTFKTVKSAEDAIATLNTCRKSRKE